MTTPVVHPGTGELFDSLDTQPPEVLAETLLALQERQAELKLMVSAVEAELRERIDARTGGLNRIAVFGKYEVEDKPVFSRTWDGEELEGVLRDLIDQGVIHAGEVADVICHKTEVSGTAAMRLLHRLGGQALTDVQGCFTWTKKAGHVKVVPSVALPAPEESQ
jgi:hypothetical protein